MIMKCICKKPCRVDGFQNVVLNYWSLFHVNCVIRILITAGGYNWYSDILFLTRQKMADNEDGEERTSRRNKWEVVTLTASIYEAASGSGQVELKDNDQGDASIQDEAETSRALFMSRHFVFPPIEHENLPLESDYSEILGQSGLKDVSKVIVDDGARPSGKDEENVMISGTNVSEAFSGVPYFDDKMSKFSVHGKQFAEGTTLEDFDLIVKEESMYDTTKYSSLHCDDNK